MKRYTYLLLAAFSTGLLAGCSDFLDSDPMTSLVESTFYKTEKDATMALVGCYDGLQTIWADGMAVPVSSLVMADECFGGTGVTDGFGYRMVDEFDQSLSPTDVNIYNPNWILYYKAIYRCNMLLSKLDQINWKTDRNREQVEAECRFIRAFIYFEMVRLWENIPLVTSPLSVSESNIPQSDPDDVYALIAEDLLFASKYAHLAGETWTEGWAGVNDGHVTVYAAKAMLARVYLYYVGYYNKTSLPNGTTKDAVKDSLLTVYTSGHGLVKPYSDLWPSTSTVRDASEDPIGLKTTYVGEGNKETVWAIKFNSNGKWSPSTIDGFIAMKMLGLRNGQVESFGTTVYGDGSWGGATVNPLFVDGWKTAEPTDPRLNWSVIDCVKEGITMTSNHSQDEYTGYFTKKYTCLGNGKEHIYVAQSLDFQINQYQDFVVIRYADVLLMLSELTGDATYLNEVRDRVGLPAVAYSVDNLRKERTHELAFEGLRYWDMLRYDHTLQYAASAVTIPANTLKVIKGGGDPGTYKAIDGANLINCRGLAPIPNKQITLSNGVLKQNTGWGDAQ